MGLWFFGFNFPLKLILPLKLIAITIVIAIEVDIAIGIENKIFFVHFTLTTNEAGLKIVFDYEFSRFFEICSKFT